MMRYKQQNDMYDMINRVYHNHLPEMSELKYKTYSIYSMLLSTIGSKVTDIAVRIFKKEMLEIYCQVREK
jgi:hypothetical protein